MIPRSRNGYANFCTPGVVTDRGWVSTGPIAAYGGHPHGPLDTAKVAEAYGGIENAWCDIRITDGKIGPWVSGRVRPGVSAETVYAVRASKISGHWKAGDLKAIVSVNFPGFDVPDFQVSFDADGRVELMASFAVDCECDDDVSTSLAELLELLDDGAAQKLIDSSIVEELSELAAE
jgi:hypothetical protein